MAATIIADPLTNFFYFCIVTATYAKVSKCATVILTYKSGNKKMCSNYRSISLLSSFSKVFEICL